jgi:hypothetical protein
MGEKHLVQGFPEILQQMKAVRDLRGCRGPLPRALGLGSRAIPCDHLAPWRLLEPLRDGVGGTIREERDRGAALQIDQPRAIRLAFAQGAIIHAEDGGRGKRRGRLPAEQAQQRVPAPPLVPWVAEAHPSRPAERHAEGHEALGEPPGTPGPRGGDRGEPFGKDAAVTAAIAAKPLADAQLEAHAILCPRQISQGALRVTVDTLRRGGAQRTGHTGRPRAHAQGDLCRGIIDLARLEAQPRGIRSQAGKDGRGWCRDESGLLLPAIMSLGQRSVCVPLASGWSRVGREIYKV